MSDDTDVQGTNSEDNDLIKEMRSKLKAAEAKAKTAAEDTRKEIIRENTAVNLMGDKFEKLAPYFAQEVEGELTQEAAVKWLADKGFEGSSDSGDNASNIEQEESVGIAQELEKVTNLGSKVASADSVTEFQRVNTSISQAGDDIHGIGNLPQVTAKLAALLAE